MRNIQVEGIGPKITDNDFLAFEGRMGMKFPAEYRNFMLEYNGGYVEPSLFRIPNVEKNNIIVLNGLFSIGVMDANIEQMNQSAMDYIPEGFISIADDPGGDRFLIGLCGTKYEGQIFFWLHDQMPKDEMDTSFFLANSFDEFLNGLFEEPEE